MPEPRRGLLERHYPEVVFGGTTLVDGTVAFYTRVHALVRPEDTVLDVGCGRGRYREDPIPFRRELRILRGVAKCVIGIDPNPAAQDNPYLDEFRPIEDSEALWPVDNGSVDVCLADYVLEHVREPARFFGECHRVLKPGGVICLRTSNLLSYVGFGSRVIPRGLHNAVLSRVQPHRKAEDVFPTYYACNTMGRLKRALRQNAFDAVVLGHGGEPSYLAFSSLVYAFGVLYQRLVPKRFATTLFAFARRQGVS